MDTIEGLKARIGVLEDEAKAKDARIAELHAEVDEGRALVEEMHRSSTATRLSTVGSRRSA
jgi:hypothetical protein